MRQRLALVQALMGDPDLVMLALADLDGHTAFRSDGGRDIGHLEGPHGARWGRPSR
jgi:hypothetical protein